MSITFGMAQFKLQFQISPIILTGGIAGNIPGGMLPVISLTQAGIFTSLLSGGGDLDLDDFFAHFQPLPGATLVDNRIGMYPFANQQTAANAIITQPLSISLLMICPARDPGGYAAKLPILSAFQATLAQHNISGGTYTIATPSYLYTNCVMTGMRDVSSTESKQAQNRWQLDFLQPLITLQQAAMAQNTLMSKISSGTQVTNTAWSQPGAAVGNPASGIAPSVVPASTPLVGASAGGFNSLQSGTGPTQIPTGG